MNLDLGNHVKVFLAPETRGGLIAEGKIISFEEGPRAGETFVRIRFTNGDSAVYPKDLVVKNNFKQYVIVCRVDAATPSNEIQRFPFRAETPREAVGKFKERLAVEIIQDGMEILEVYQTIPIAEWQ